MPKDIHTPRSELICGQIDSLEYEIMKIGATHLLYLCNNIRFMAERMENKLYEYKQARLEEDDCVVYLERGDIFPEN